MFMPSMEMLKSSPLNTTGEGGGGGGADIWRQLNCWLANIHINQTQLFYLMTAKAY